ncbi:hypothetical protein M9H77_18790 [Catharanthus roseus]|uniref:Uncharacterized protein n=1 Tax=Catharanthus roseus TaxID=4058 RepID=A0ACC0B8I3_CATRO|nr:hypothetical protein M9H77_18790 [Catharanthus roseus]
MHLSRSCFGHRPHPYHYPQLVEGRRSNARSSGFLYWSKTTGRAVSQPIFFLLGGGGEILVHFMKHVCVEFSDKAWIVIAREIEERKPTQPSKRIFKPKMLYDLFIKRFFNNHIKRCPIGKPFLGGIRETLGERKNIRLFASILGLILLNCVPNIDDRAYYAAIGGVDSKGGLLNGGASTSSFALTSGVIVLVLTVPN